MIVLSPFTMLIQYINSVSTMSPELQLAVAHGIFNIVTTILFFPFINKIVVIIKKSFQIIQKNYKWIYQN